jgi:outer membrane protein OmpA-like peptidoglycan-associated protein
VRFKTPVSRLMKDLRDVVQASVPYYLEGSMAEFRRFRPRVKTSLSALDGWVVPPVPSGWEPGEWTYFQVQGALEEVLLLVSLDIGVFTNEALAENVRATEELATDWTQIRGGRDPLRPEPLPDFGGGEGDSSTLDGLLDRSESGGNGEEEPLSEVMQALQSLLSRIEALEQRREMGEVNPISGGAFPSRGIDGTWQPNPGSGQLPSPLPEQFTLAFPQGSAALGLSAEYGLNTLVEWMVAWPGVRVLVTGHSDAIGSERANMALSRRRAQVVRYYLLERGIDAQRVTAAHFGEERPEWGAVFDRRVEVRLFFD